MIIVIANYRKTIQSMTICSKKLDVRYFYIHFVLGLLDTVKKVCSSVPNYTTSSPKMWKNFIYFNYVCCGIL